MKGLQVLGRPHELFQFAKPIEYQVDTERLRFLRLPDHQEPPIGRDVIIPPTHARKILALEQFLDLRYPELRLHLNLSGNHFVTGAVEQLLAVGGMFFSSG